MDFLPVPPHTPTHRWAKERGMTEDLRQLCRDPAVVAAVMKSMQEEGRVAQLRGFEHVQVGGLEDARNRILVQEREKWFLTLCVFTLSGGAPHSRPILR